MDGYYQQYQNVLFDEPQSTVSFSVQVSTLAPGLLMKACAKHSQTSMRPTRR
jgi:hypothetical protein